MLKPQTQSRTDSVPSLKPSQESKQKTNQLDMMKLDRLLRKTRSKPYMDAIQHLDAGGHVCNSQQTKEIIDAIQMEFPEVELSGVLLGIVSKCYLGDDYEVHSLDATGDIIEHFRRGQPLKGGLEKARAIAILGGYEFIEVYSDCCRAVSSNGNVSVIK
jgi:hypothetical protein